MRIDSKKSGLGDAWMRLLALATLTRLRPGTRHTIYPPAVLVPLASELFADYFDVAADGVMDIEMQHMGLRTFLPGLLRGRAYYAPFYWILRLDRKKTEMKDRINDVAFELASYVTRLSLPNRDYTHEYQGFMEMQGLKPFKTITKEEYYAAAPAVLLEIKRKLHEMFPSPAERTRDVVFPSGTAHQIMPLDFAVKHFPQARIAFHKRDAYAEGFRNHGFEMVYFETPAEILGIMSQAHTVYCSDTFPAHLAQTWGDDCFLFMAQVTTTMVVTPGFPRERVFHSFAPCHPCRSRARITPESVCEAGQYYCFTWATPGYEAQVPNAFPVLEKEA